MEQKKASIQRTTLLVLYRVACFSRDLSELFVDFLKLCLIHASPVEKTKPGKSLGMTSDKAWRGGLICDERNENRDYVITVSSSSINYKWGERSKKRYYLRWHTDTKLWEFWHHDKDGYFAHTHLTLHRKGGSPEDLRRIKNWLECFYWHDDVVKQYIGGKRASQLIKEMRDYVYSDED